MASPVLNRTAPLRGTARLGPRRRFTQLAMLLNGGAWRHLNKDAPKLGWLVLLFIFSFLHLATEFLTIVGSGNSTLSG